MLIQVAVPVPGLGALTYQVPDGAGAPPAGARVLVPLGGRTVTGVVVEAAQHVQTPAEGVKPVLRVLDAEPFLPGEVMSLALWTAEYYLAGPGETLTMVLPPRTRGGRADAHKTRRVVSITADGRLVVSQSVGELPPRTVTQKQREVLGLLAEHSSGTGMLPVSQLAEHGLTASVVARLAKMGLVEVRSERVSRDPFGDNSLRDAQVGHRTLTTDQQRVVDRLTELLNGGGYRAALLHGVTGSGKTEVYLRLSAAARALGRRALVLVPEIALTPAVAGLFQASFQGRVAIQHSGLSEGERHDQWQLIRSGGVDVVVGTRSAVFAPIARLGLVIVDEEHDASYKQEESPRYNARDVSVMRAMHAGALVVLGSATPSMETYHNAMSGRYEHLVLESRVMGRPLADVSVVDMREIYAAEGPDVVLSPVLIRGLESRLDKREQSLVLLNRRGYATTVFCRQCGGTIDCPNCSVSLVVHGEGRSRRVRCHYCGYSTGVPQTCPSCGGPFMEQAGFGTERVEAEVRRAFPSARVSRLDRDAIRRKGSLATLLTQFRNGEIDVLVGTQMIAKGHDFPRVTLVGVVSADVGLGMADFRAAERTFQLLTQVAGRAGRGEQPGEAIVQTLYPNHYSIKLACQQDYPAFYQRERSFRQSMLYPPMVFLVNAVVRAPTLGRALKDAGDLVQQLQERGGAGRDFRVLGPAPAPLGKLRKEYRAQLLVKGTSRRLMREALAAVLDRRPDLRRRVIVDVDPLSVL
ncbi:MAG: primosomal protein N' [Acidobacteria bacterium]|nr:MAG: primosomal protein N' [Acidobacteriota bacterium]